MRKFIFVITLLLVGFFSVQKAHAFIALPYFNITINQHTIGSDGTFGFDVEGGTPENFFTDHPSITTTAGLGTVTEYSMSPNGAHFLITQDPLTGWQKPTIVCTSSNNGVVSTPTDDGTGIAITPVSFSSITCDFTNSVSTGGSSSVLFIPGFEASRLYTKGSILNPEDQLWEPNSNADVEDLFMNSAGVSKNKNIYTRDIIARTNLPIIHVDLYKGFESLLDGMVTDHAMTSWLAAPYDWRYDPKYIVDHGQIDSNGNLTFIKDLAANQKPYIVGQLETLAQSSKTGKVTIVTHSNGGLIVKALLEKLQALHDAGGNDDISKIDTIIMVAAPQLGTPDSIAKLLHGSGTAIAGGLILNEITARTFGSNLPGAYALLPSEKYFSTVTAPVVRFDPETDSVSNFRSKYGDTITTYEGFKNFLLGLSDKRKNAPTDDLIHPLILNSTLVNNADAIHSDIDNYQIPSSIRVYKIAGWGEPTTTGVEYTTKPDCLTVCVPVLDERLIQTSDGDATVVSPSATYGLGDVYYVNLRDYNKSIGKNFKHKDIFETAPVENFVKNILTNAGNLPPYVVQAKPFGVDNLVLSIHSPVTLDLYDTEGNHTGLSSDQPVTDFKKIDEEIPNSSYTSFGEGSYISVPKGEAYSVAIAGTDFGTFTFQKEEYVNDQRLNSAGSVFADIPVTPMTNATLSVDTAGVPTQMQLDIDGDGVVDQTIVPGQEFDPTQYLEMMKKTIISMQLSPSVENALIKKIVKLETQIQAGKIKNAKKKIQNLMQGIKIKHNGHNKYINNEDKQTIVDMLNQLLDNIN